MGLTSQYHKYTAAGICSLIGSGKCNVVWIEYDGKKGKYCAVGACENVIIWDLKTGEQVTTLPGDRHEVVRLAAFPNGQHLAVGYHNGTIKLFDIKSGEDLVTFSGHKTAVTALAFDERGMLLASGSRDTDIIIWDTVSQSGLYRLKGHKGLVTQLVFLRSQNILISSSKDTFVKFWDLDTQHCFRTLLTHKTEVYGLQLSADETHLFTGSADNEIRVYNIEPVRDEEGRLRPPQSKKPADQNAAISKKKRKKIRSGDDDSGVSVQSESEGEDGEEGEESEEEFNQEERLLSCQYMGSLTRHGKGRTVSLQVDRSGRALVCHGLDRTIESFLILTKEEKTQLQKKRASKLRKRMRAAGEDDSLTTADKHQLSVEEQFKRHEPVRLPAKPGSVDITCSSAGLCKFVALLSNNSLYGGEIDVSEKKSEMSRKTHLATPGHRTDVRALSFSNDGSAIASASGDQLKVWNRDSLRCIRTMSCGYALCCAFLPGDRHIVVGTKSGALQLFDIASSTMVEEIDAHTGAVWSLCVLPDKRGIVTGSADHKVKFWQFELIDDEDEEEEDASKTKLKKETKSPSVSKRLTLVPTRVLKMSDDVLCVKVSADSRFVAVSLLDNTIKVFFADTLKFFLSLYGHSLPALCIDISSDGTILASGSADKNIKIWGLDFGDCHKSIFAHDDSIMGLAFLPKTHLFFSCGKDGAIKQWDADTFNHVTTLSPAHHGEVWSVVPSPSGMSLASSSHDKSIRVWEKADEVLVLEEEKEQEREREFDMEIENEENPVVPGETSGEIGFAGKKTVESVKSTERIMEAVEIWRTEKDTVVKEEDLHPMLRAYKCKSAVDYILEVLKKVKPSELEESLLVMPFDFSTDLLKVLDFLLRQKRCVELVTKCLMFLMRIHHNQITSNQMLLPTIDRLRDSSTSTAEEYKDRIGYNLSALQLLQLRLEDNNSQQLFTDATEMFKKKEKRRKQKHKGPEIV